MSAWTWGPCAMGEWAGTGSTSVEARGLRDGLRAYLGRRCPRARCGHSPSRRSRSSGSSRPRWRSCGGRAVRATRPRPPSALPPTRTL